MLSRKNTVILMLAALVALTAIAPALAEDKAPETAVFAVPNLKDEAVVKDLAKALAKVKGVTAAKPDAEASKFLVTFNPEKTNPEKLTAAMAKIAPEAKFEGVQAADGKTVNNAGCGACPSKATCGKKK